MKKYKFSIVMICVICLFTACYGKPERKTDENGELVQENTVVKQSSAKAKKMTYKIYVGEMVGIGTESMEIKNIPVKSIITKKAAVRKIAAKKGVTYQSSDDKIAKVYKDGTVLGLKGGKAIISIKKGKQMKKIRIIVKKRGMVYPIFHMMKGEHLDLQFSNSTVISNWASDHEKIASVTKQGRVTAKKKGHATIYGTDGKRIYACKLTIMGKKEPAIYLTFDDGPDRYTTPRTLDILKENKVKATFFEIKPEKENYDLTERVIKEGHSLAIHGYEHKYDTIYRSAEIYKENLDKLQEFFFKKWGVWCSITRFPGGSSNMVSRYNPGVMTSITKQIHGWGYHYFDWNVASGDSDGLKTSEALYQNVICQLSKEHDNIVLMHDYINNDVMLGALERIIQYGKANGYTFLPITASTPEVHHTVNN